METYLWFNLVLGAIAVIVRVFLLGYKVYPRTTEHSRLEDAVAVMVGTGLAAWAIVLLLNT